MQSSTQDVAGSGKSMLCCEGGKVAWDSQGSLHLEPPQSLLHLVHFQARPQHGSDGLGGYLAHAYRWSK